MLSFPEASSWDWPPMQMHFRSSSNSSMNCAHDMTMLLKLHTSHNFSKCSLSLKGTHQSCVTSRGCSIWFGTGPWARTWVTSVFQPSPPVSLKTYCCMYVGGGPRSEEWCQSYGVINSNNLSGGIVEDRGDTLLVYRVFRYDQKKLTPFGAWQKRNKSKPNTLNVVFWI